MYLEHSKLCIEQTFIIIKHEIGSAGKNVSTFTKYKDINIWSIYPIFHRQCYIKVFPFQKNFKNCTMNTEYQMVLEQRGTFEDSHLRCNEAVRNERFT